MARRGSIYSAFCLDPAASERGQVDIESLKSEKVRKIALPLFFRTISSITHSPRPLAAGSKRNAEKMEPSLIMASQLGTMCSVIND